MTTHALLTIGQFAQAASTTPRTLRHFEALGLLRSCRAENGRRLYDAQAVTAFLHIMTLKSAGFSLSEIKNFTHGSINTDTVLDTHIALLESKLRETEKALTTLKNLRDESPQAADLNLQDFCQLLRNASRTQHKTALAPLLQKHFTPAERAQWESTANKHFPDAEQDLYGLRWENLIKRIDQALIHGLQPTAPEAAHFVHEWRTLQEPLQNALGRDLWNKTANLYTELHKSPQAKNAPFSAEVFQFIQAAAHHLKAVEHQTE